jgi:hypothetical protein
MLVVFLPGVAAQEVDSVGLLELFELAFEVPGEYDNPYDPSQVAVSAIFTAPDGGQISVPGFFMQPYDDQGEESGAAGWRVRFAPTQIGEWTYRIEAQGPDTSLTIDQGRVNVTPSDTRGMVRVSPNGRYFNFQNGEPYFPVGQNLGWSWDEGGGLDAYLTWLDDLAASGGNYARIFVDTAWFIGLDWAGPAGDYSNEQLAAWRMDRILQEAEARGIYLQVVLIWHQAFTRYGGIPVVPPGDVPRADVSADFESHSYNSINGGPMDRPETLYLDSRVPELLHRRLAYMLARWGYSRNIFAWELITDVDRLPGYDADFILDLADFVSENDPYNHLMTVGSREVIPELVESFDFVQIRSFQSRPIESNGDQVMAIMDAVRSAQVITQKPILVTAFSLNPWYEPTEDDPGGVHVQNSIWAVTLSGAAGGAMPSWWDTYIARQDLYGLFTPLARFTAGVNWNALQLTPVDVGLNSARNEPYASLQIDGFNRRRGDSSPIDTYYRISPDGVVPPVGTLSSYLYGRAFNAGGSFPYTFILTPSTETNLAIAIRAIASGGSANLAITVDNQPYTSLQLTAGGEDVVINIPLTAGEHRIVLDNRGDQWIELESLVIENYVPPARAVALADRAQGVALVWLQNRAYTWQNGESALEPLRFRLDIPGMPPGDYRVEFWDTSSGQLLGEDLIRADAASLSIDLLPFTTQIALRAFRINTPEVIQATSTPIPTRTLSVEASPTTTSSPTPTETAPPSPTPSNTATASPSATATVSATNTESIAPTSTQTASATPTQTGSPSTPTIIPRATRTPRPN